MTDKTLTPSQIVTLIRRIAKKNPENLKNVLSNFLDKKDVSDLYKSFERSGTITPTEIREKLGAPRSSEKKDSQESTDKLINKAVSSVKDIETQYPSNWGEGNVKLKMLTDIYPKMVSSSRLFKNVGTFIEKVEPLMDTDPDKLDNLMNSLENYSGESEIMKDVSMLINAAHKKGIIKQYMSRMKTPKEVEQGNYEYNMDESVNRFKKANLKEEWMNMDPENAGPDYYAYVDHIRKSMYQAVKNAVKLYEMIDDPDITFELQPWMFGKMSVIAAELDAIHKALDWAKDQRSQEREMGVPAVDPEPIGDINPELNADPIAPEDSIHTPDVV